MHGFFDRAGSADSSRLALSTTWPSALGDGVSTPIRLISRLNSPACTCPCERFAAPSRVANASLGVTVDRYSFGVGLSHPLLHAGLSRRFPPGPPRPPTSPEPLWRRRLDT